MYIHTLYTYARTRNGQSEYQTKMPMQFCPFQWYEFEDPKRKNGDDSA